MNNQKLAIIVLGHPNAGKSSTWYELFGRIVRSSRNGKMKQLPINKEEIKAFLRNSSFEESGIDIEDYIDILLRNASFEEWGDDAEDFFDENNLPNIVLCSVQYIEKGLHTINWFKEHGYYLYIQWLNPGHHDSEEYDDSLGFETKFKPHGQFAKWSGKEKTNRVVAIRQFLYSWVLKLK